MFGWILFGPCDNSNIEATAHQSFHTTIDQELYDLIQRFWLLDEIPQTNQLLSPDEQACEDYYKSTVQRDPNGRYIVKLPFQRPANSLGRSKEAAERMLNRIIKKMETEPSYKEAYTKFLTEYESLGHMQAIPTADLEPEPVYYLPHHGILRESSLTTKFRVVFNASSKTTSGVSL
ncbi:GSCOCG00012868001-RA-CDS, partial [Cotesia congregata]